MSQYMIKNIENFEDVKIEKNFALQITLKKRLGCTVSEYFKKYNEGIYEISILDYFDFLGYPSKRIKPIHVKKMYFLKKKYKNFYLFMFLIINHKNELQIVNNGFTKKIKYHSLSFFYNNLTSYYENLNQFISPYIKLQNKISKDIQESGGSGLIHGCIIDIDGLNHIYVNPYDLKITPYFALSMTKKFVYKNVASLMHEKCYDKYLRMKSNSKANEIDLYGKFDICENSVYEPNTQIYSISRVFLDLQTISKTKVITVWNDDILNSLEQNNSNLVSETNNEIKYIE